MWVRHSEMKWIAALLPLKLKVEGKVREWGLGPDGLTRLPKSNALIKDFAKCFTSASLFVMVQGFDATSRRTAGKARQVGI